MFQMGWFNHQLVIVEKSKNLPALTDRKGQDLNDRIAWQGAHVHWGAATTQMTRDYGLVGWLVGWLSAKQLKNGACMNCFPTLSNISNIPMQDPEGFV